MELEIINKLYLELSQVATAHTEREIILDARVTELSDRLVETNNRAAAAGKRADELYDLLVSANAIAERKGEDTNWDIFAARLRAAGVHAVTPRAFRKPQD